MKDLPDFLKDVKKIGFFGFGKSNRAVFDFLSKRMEFTAVVREERSLTRDLPEGIEYLSGNDCFELRGEDVIFLSPSVRRERDGIRTLADTGAILSSDAELFFSLNRKPLLAVSGSDGKSTTVRMTEAILNSSGASALACGNIGLPFVNAAEASASCLVTELSSFTLEYTQPHSRRALITNITENHLDWHGSYKRYIAAKENLLRNADECLLSPDSADSVPLIERHRPWGLFSTERHFSDLREKYPFAKQIFTLEGDALAANGEPMISVASLAKKEPHNIKNALAALALTQGICDTGRGIEALRSFSGLSHRMETVATIDGVGYVDSSIDSTPERTRATLAAMPERLILLLGGRGKGLSYDPLCEPLLKKRGAIIISGENREEIAEALAAFEQLKKRIVIKDSLEEATREAMRLARCGDTVLLSPASTSYDAFNDFEERGNKFKEYLKTEG